DIGVPLPQEGELSDLARTLVIADGGGVHVSTQAPNVTGASRVWVTFTVAGSVDYIRLYCGARVESGSPGSGEPSTMVLATNFLVEESDFPTSFFDGDSPEADWQGTPELSVSVWE